MVRKVFFSFHYDKDVFRVQQVRNIGSLEDNKPISATEWEDVKRKGNDAVDKWIDYNIGRSDCVVVLIGSETANRTWVIEEIKKAWNNRKGVFGIYIHNLSCPRNGKCSKGQNPFDKLTLPDGTKLSAKVQCYDPNPSDAYNAIKDGIERCVEIAIAESKNR